MFLDHAGYLYRQDNETASVKDPKKIYTMVDEYEWLGSITVDNSSLEKAYNYVKENYSLDNWCNKILDLYNNLLENGKRNAE